MSDFKFLLPIVPFNSVLGASIAARDGYPILNTRGGAYSEGTMSDAATTEFGIVYTVGSAKLVNFLVVSNIRGLIEADGSSIGLRLYYNSVATFYTYTVDESDLVGPQQKDFVTAVTAQTETYFQFRTITGSSLHSVFSKVFLGAAFEMDREPLTVDIRDMSLGSGDRRKSREFQIVFEGITPAKKTEFVETVVPYCKHTPIFLWDSQDRLFYGDELVYANLVDYRCKPNVREVWTVETTWREAI